MTDGERWTRDVLDELRTASFTPAAWRRFVAGSFARAREQRTAHRRAHAQTLVLAGGGLGVASLVALAGRPGPALVGAAWWVLLTLMLDWHLGMLQRPDGRPLVGLGVANVVTVVRGASIPVLLFVSEPGLLAAVAASVLLDVLDGSLARRRDEATRLGAWLDGSVDTLTATVAALAAARLGSIPDWLGVFIVARVAAPWVVLVVAYFALPARLSRLSLRAPGLLARLPGAAATLGVGLALAGLDAGVPLAAAGVAASFAAFGIQLVQATSGRFRLRAT